MLNDAIKINSGEWSAYICPRLGGNVIKLTYNAGDVLHPLTDEEKLKVNPYLYGAPILMPANRTYRGKFVFEGKEYTLPLNEPNNNCNLHGSVLFQAFDTVSVASDSVTLRLVDAEAKSYPFPFELTVRYALTNEGFSSEHTVKNIGNGNMPLTFALHTTFVEPQEFCVPIELCQEKNEHHIPTGRYVPLNEQERGYVTGSPSCGAYVSGYFRSFGNTARIGDYSYSVSDNFDHWILYNGNGASGFLCVEPQSGSVNGLNAGASDNACRLLKKGEQILFKTFISKI